MRRLAIAQLISFGAVSIRRNVATSDKISKTRPSRKVTEFGPSEHEINGDFFTIQRMKMEFARTLPHFKRGTERHCEVDPIFETAIGRS
jgi:hypothetical protein